MSNLLALPLAVADIETGTNENWVDSLVFLVNSDDPVNGPQLDLRGLSFEMEVRRTRPDHEVILTVTSKDGGMAIGNPPDYGFLIINVPLEEMTTKEPDEYVGDIRASDGTMTRRCLDFTLTITEGITR
jgi:hypothetical protein